MAHDLYGFSARLKANPSTAGFVLDFDGTLSGIAGQPGAAVPVEGAPEVLEHLARTYRVVAVLSGRRAGDLERMVGARGVIYIGLYGAERIEAGRLVRPPDAERWREAALRLAQSAEAMVAAEGLAGTEVEYKDLAISIHYRNAPDSLTVEAILAWAEASAPREGFEHNLGRMVVEVRPRGVSKASTLERIIADNGLGMLVVAGDDFADVEALRRAGEILGEDAFRFGIASSEQPEGLEAATDLIVPTPEALLGLIRSFLPPGALKLPEGGRDL